MSTISRTPVGSGSLSRAEAAALLGCERPAEQRESCKRLGIEYTQRRRPLPGGGTYRIDECDVWATAEVVARLDAVLDRAT